MTVYKIPASKATRKENRFYFAFPGSSKQYSVPLLSYLPPSLIRIVETVDDDNISTVITFLDEFLTAVAPDAHLIDKFQDTNQMLSWFAAWQEASGIDMGESSASVKSSETTEAH